MELNGEDRNEDGLRCMGMVGDGQRQLELSENITAYYLSHLQFLRVRHILHPEIQPKEGK